MICEIITTLLIILFIVAGMVLLEGVFVLVVIGIIFLFAWLSDKAQTDDWANDTRPDEDFHDDCL